MKYEDWGMPLWTTNTREYKRPSKWVANSKAVETDQVWYVKLPNATSLVECKVLEVTAHTVLVKTRGINQNWGLESRFITEDITWIEQRENLSKSVE